MRSCYRSVLVAAISLTVVGSAWSQTPPAAGPQASPSPAQQSTDIKEILPAPGGYSYNGQGRRDPFMSLIRPVTADSGPRTRRPGVEGFLIQEVALRGILKNVDGYLAFLEGADNKSYWARVGQRLFDGQIVAIDAATVTFKQEVTDPLSPVRSKEVKKTLYPSEEATQ
jgi:Tfp pilus assembly protein PilP